jgi:hypothetical protein
MARLSVVDFTTQSANIKGQNSEILKLQVPQTRQYRAIPQEGMILLLGLRQDFTVTETGGSAKTPTLTLDYPIAPEPATNPIGSDIIGYYSTDGSTFTKGTKVTSAPASDGQYQITDKGAGTIKTYAPASSTRYWRFYFRPGAGRISIANIPSLLSLDAASISVWEAPCKSLFSIDQISVYTRPRIGESALWPSRSYLAIKLEMPDQTATQTNETGVTKTVTRQALFIPYSSDTTPWDEAVFLLDIPIMLL